MCLLVIDILTNIYEGGSIIMKFQQNPSRSFNFTEYRNSRIKKGNKTISVAAYFWKRKSKSEFYTYITYSDISSFDTVG